MPALPSAGQTSVTVLSPPQPAQNSTWRPFDETEIASPNLSNFAPFVPGTLSPIFTTVSSTIGLLPRRAR